MTDIGGGTAAGLPAVQVREKDLSAAELATLCRRMREPTRERGALLIVNDRADLALAVGADGLHVGQDDLPAAVVARARRVVAEAQIDLSCANWTGLRRCSPKRRKGIGT